MSTTTYDTSWGNGYSQVFSSFSALMFVAAGMIIGIRLHLPGNTLARFLGLLLLYKGLAAFWNHATNETFLELRYLDISAQLWLVNQIFVWVVLEAPHESCFWVSRGVAVLAAHLGGWWVMVVSPEQYVLWGVLVTQIGSIFVCMVVYEVYHRRRWFALIALGVFLMLLGVTFVTRNETSILLGKFGMCWFHSTQVYLILGWYIFWSQRHERTLIWGCGESLNAVYCC